MTGYGRGAAERAGTRVTVEISAVNRKQTDIRVVLPKEIASLEPQFRAHIQKLVTRGCLTVSVTYQLSAEMRREQVRIDTEVAAHMVERLRALARTLGVDERLTLADVVALPGIVTAEETQVPLQTLAELIDTSLQTALADLRRMQTEEGRALQKDLRERCGRLREHVAAIRAQEHTVIEHYRDRLRKRLANLGLDLPVDDERLAKEIAFTADRCDITEELVRLESHLDQMQALLTDGEDAGRALEFLCQELHREINTLSAKACDLAVADLALQFKNELGRVREQICNVE